jgi:uncharacterized protein (TIGR02466 family)
MTDNRLQLIFPTTIFVKNNLLMNELEVYKKNILEYFEKNKTTKTFYNSKLQNSYFDNMNYIFQNSIYTNLIKEILFNCSVYCKELGYSEEQISKYGIQSIWANLIKKNDYHGIHTHSNRGNALISGVFYVDAPETSFLKFENPYRNFYLAEDPENKNIYNFDCYDYKCTPGTLILFKSYTKHGYDSHLNEKDKIGIAFNYGRRQ